MPADSDHLGLYYTSAGTRPCSLSTFFCRRLGVVDGGATGFQLTIQHWRLIPSMRHLSTVQRTNGPTSRPPDFFSDFVAQSTVMEYNGHNCAGLLPPKRYTIRCVCQWLFIERLRLFIAHKFGIAQMIYIAWSRTDPWDDNDFFNYTRNRFPHQGEPARVVAHGEALPSM